MYVLIADSGSTKTDWVVSRGREIIKRVRTTGLNPYFHSREDISREIIDKLRPQITECLPRLSEIHYYGTGCSSIENCALIRDCLRDSLTVPAINVSHDLLAAARALCGHEWGIAAILGTGSNSCLYNGEQIIENVPSAGYLWSDYGGGSQIGKFFIREYFERRLPDDLRTAFEEAGYNREVILENVYKRNSPNRYLASVSLFVNRFSSHPAVISLLEECFNSFFEQQVNQYTDAKKYPVHMVGSVAFFYKEMIRAVAAKHGYSTGTIIQSPMEGLLEFHSM